MKNFGSVMEAARAKANDVMETAKAVQQRVAEATGNVDKSDDDPVIQQHYANEALLRRVAKHSEGYVKAVRAMCDATRCLADDFVEATESLPELQDAASQFEAATNLSRQLAVVAQAINQLVSGPVLAELEGRKDLERRLSDRKKVRADYEAYRKKQTALAASDPANRQVYAANLEAAQQTFSRHSEGVVRDVRGVNKERTNRACSSLLAVLASHSALIGVASSSLGTVGGTLAKVFEGVPAMGQTYNQVQSEIRKQPLAEPAPRRPPAFAAEPPPSEAPPAQTRTSPPSAAARSPASAPVKRPSQPPPAPSPPPLDEGSEDFDPFGIKSETASGRASQASLVETEDLLGGFGATPTPPPLQSGGSTEDLLSGFTAAPLSVSQTSSMAADMDIMGMGMGAMDELTALSAPPALAPETIAQPRPRATTMPQSQAHSANSMDDFFMTGASPPASAPPKPPRATSSSKAPSLLGDDPFGMGSMMNSDPFGDPNDSDVRRRLRAQKEAETNAAIASKVNALKEKEMQAESNRETERELEKSLKLKVAAWKREKKNIRSLLASLHEVAPPCSWKPMSLGELLDEKSVKKAYRKAIMVVHPDKQDDPNDLSAKVLAQLVFDALREAWGAFEKTG
ncbi:hypothetical protein AB1Y20_012132 [Prymnesium parvum]|uniref:J domain-containing protein n=1 Tax=Prymnesium parvum TaxID=97485 RepID=A0AB34IPQ1_PRYPA|mmetsp:Transcript_20082/g.48144  ORF Transcript_20082/g.48144 Transcript_20082/m.48144 type:complete len:628 (+) Transcript_20082:154-2037(+)